MKRILFGLFVLPFCAILLTGCLTAPVIPPTGAMFSQFKAPLDIDYQATPVRGKVGTAQTQSILGLVAWGDASARTAADNAGISKIEYADYDYFNVLGVYQRYDTIVYGE